MGSSEFLSKAAIDDVQVLKKCPSPHHPTVTNVVALAHFWAASAAGGSSTDIYAMICIYLKVNIYITLS